MTDLSEVLSAPDYPIVHYLRRVRLRDGGVVRAVLDTCSLLASCGNSVTLFTTDPSDVPREWTATTRDVPKVETIPTPSFLRHISPKADSILRGARVLHLHGAWEVTNLALARRATRLGIPYIVSIHGMLDDWSLKQKRFKKHLFLSIVGRRFLAGAAKVHCTALAEQSQASRQLRPGSSVIIPYPVDLSSFFACTKDNASLVDRQGANRLPRILYLSRLHPKKRPDLLIQATRLLERLGRTCEVILAGPSDPTYMAELRRLACRHEMEERAHFPGMVVGQEKLALYESADVFVLPTSQENFGIVLVEAMAAGIPVITTRGVDIWQELESAGAIIVDQDAEQIARAIHSLISDIPTARRLGQKGREWVFKHLDPRHVIAQYEDMYAGCIESPRNAPQCIN